MWDYIARSEEWNMEGNKNEPLKRKRFELYFCAVCMRDKAPMQGWDLQLGHYDMIIVTVGGNGIINKTELGL